MNLMAFWSVRPTESVWRSRRTLTSLFFLGFSRPSVSGVGFVLVVLSSTEPRELPGRSGAPLTVWKRSSLFGLLVCGEVEAVRGRGTEERPAGGGKLSSRAVTGERPREWVTVMKR